MAQEIESCLDSATGRETLKFKWFLGRGGALKRKTRDEKSSRVSVVVTTGVVTGGSYFFFFAAAFLAGFFAAAFFVVFAIVITPFRLGWMSLEIIMNSL